MKNQHMELTLSSICGGSLPERFTHELEKILKNVMDPNTDAEVARKMKIIIEFKPDEDRQILQQKAVISSVLAPLSPVKSYSTITKEIDGELKAFEIKPLKTQSLPMGDNVTPIDRKEKAND